MILASSRSARAASFAIAIAASAAGQALGQHFPDETGLMEIIRTRVDDGRATGIVLGVVEPDGSRTIVAYGHAGADARPLSAESVFEIGSITKAFTGILLAEMAERGDVLLRLTCLEQTIGGAIVKHRTHQSRSDARQRRKQAARPDGRRRDHIFDAGDETEFGSFLRRVGQQLDHKLPVAAGVDDAGKIRGPID